MTAAMMLEVVTTNCACCDTELTVAWALVYNSPEKAYEPLCRECTLVLFAAASEAMAVRIDGEATETHEK